MSDVHRPLRSPIEMLDKSFIQQHGLAKYLQRLLSMQAFWAADEDVARSGHCHNHIGEGQCGIVYALCNTHDVVKVVKEGKVPSLEQDSRTHERVLATFDNLDNAIVKPAINIPGLVTWIEPEDWAWWAAQGVDETDRGMYPAILSHSLVTSRILPLQETAHEALFDYFAPSQLKIEPERSKALGEETNRDCLIRIYLGRRQPRSPTANFKLRNFDLMVNEMEALHLDTSIYATTMARTLAILHWGGVGTDGNDIEFVLGEALRANPVPSLSEFCKMAPSDLRRKDSMYPAEQALGMWLLDFNQCAFFDHDKAGLKRLVDAFFWTDPYYPWPNSKDARDEALWKVCKEAYLETSEKVAELNMARDFIDAVEGHRPSIASLFS
ncbi:hypothetical protein LTR95_016088 [Oleoguttula sp. CCFEE 5521]